MTIPRGGEAWLQTVVEKVAEHHDRAEDVVARATAAAATMHAHARTIADRVTALAAEGDSAAAAWAQLAVDAAALAESTSSVAHVMTGFQNWIAAIAGDVAVTRDAVAAADARADRRITDIRAAGGGPDQDAAVAEVLGETRAANDGRIAGLRDWIRIPRQP